MTLKAIVPTKWGVDCEDSPNDCSLSLKPPRQPKNSTVATSLSATRERPRARLDYCKSSVLFTGDAEEVEEAELDSLGPVTPLQVGHHGSDTSNSVAFIKRVAPKYAVVSSGKVEEGTINGYCHPRLSTVQTLSAALGGLPNREVQAFDGAVKCKDLGHAEHWCSVSTSDHLWFTERDGDVELVTTGDGTFQRATHEK